MANKRSGPGQPPYEPTDADRTTVMMMVAGGFTHEEICLCIGKKGISGPTLRKHFRFELDAGTAKVNMLCTKGIVQAMTQGQAWALCFWAKTRMGWRDRDANEANSDGADRLSEVLRLAQYGPARPKVIEGSATAIEPSRA